MSEQEKIKLYKHLSEAMKRSTKAMLERKAKLGESIVMADENGSPIEVSAAEALTLYSKSDE